MNGFEVEPAALRAAAGQVRALGQECSTRSGTIAAQVQAGTAVNLGYATSAALEAFAGQLGTSVSTCGQSVTAHGESLEAAAEAYERVDEDVAALFRRA